MQKDKETADKIYMEIFPKLKKLEITEVEELLKLLKLHYNAISSKDIILFDKSITG